MIDHSLIYRRRSLRNLPHLLRLRAIEQETLRLALRPGISYADFGCSNGYITDRVRALTRASLACGFDCVEKHLERGRREHPSVRFGHVDLNRLPQQTSGTFDFVTCFETLEHVGRMEAALDNLLAALKPGGTALITVPIEIGVRGSIKFAIKLACGYGLSELPQQPSLFRRYAGALLTGARISQFRDRAHGWWGTHFGFDYRDLDDALRRRGVPFRAWNSGTTRFYHVRVAREDDWEREQCSARPGSSRPL